MADQQQGFPLTFEQRIDAIMAALAAGNAAFDLRMEALTHRHEALTQRHEALTRRHEALAMSLELLGHDVQQTSAEVRATTANVDKLSLRMDQLTRVVEIDADNIRRLANVAEAHEQRLSDLEGPRKQ